MLSSSAVPLRTSLRLRRLHSLRTLVRTSWRPHRSNPNFGRSAQRCSLSNGFNTTPQASSITTPGAKPTVATAVAVAVAIPHNTAAAAAAAAVPFWQRLGPLTSIGRAYSRAQRRRPWVTQFCIALIIYATADLSAQYIGSDDGNFNPDTARTGRSLIIGGGAAIPSYLWFMWLSHNFNYSSRILSLATKIVVSQVFFTPAFNTYFFGMQAMLSGCSPSQVVDRIIAAVPTSVAMSYRFWPLVTAFSFTFIPIEHRNVFSGVIAIGWQTYLALLNRRAEVEAVAEIDKAQVDVGLTLSEGRRIAAT